MRQAKGAICREYKIHWDTLQRILTYAEPPTYEPKQPRKKPKIGEFVPIIHEILKSDQQVHRKQRHTAKRIFERLQVEHEYEGGYGGQVLLDPGGGSQDLRELSIIKNYAAREPFDARQCLVTLNDGVSTEKLPQLCPCLQKMDTVSASPSSEHHCDAPTESLRTPADWR
jgi:hypothetical protein